MRHRKRRRKLSRSSSHRLALLRNLASALIKEEKILTTVAKAKELKSFAEHLITLAKKGDITSRRLVARHIHKKDLVKKLFDIISPRFSDRTSGFTRIVRTGKFRKGDGAELAVVCLIGSEGIRLEEKAQRIERKKKTQPSLAK
jgi:large subunit ribosomal protein L17